MKNTLLLALTFTIFSFVALVPFRAQAQTLEEPVEELELTPTPTAQTTQNLKERIEKLVEEKREQIKGVLSELGSQKQGFIGEVQRVSAEAITVKTLRDTRVIPLGANTTILKGTKAAQASDIAVGDWIVVLGTIKDDALVPARILVSSESLRPKPQVVVLGTVTDTTRTSAVIAPRGGGENVSFNLLKSTAYQDINGDTLKQTDLKQDLQVLAIGFKNNDTIEASTIRILTATQPPDEP